MSEDAETDGVHAHAPRQVGIHETNEERSEKLRKLMPGKFYDLRAEHAKLCKFVHENPLVPARILSACVEYMKHGTPEMIRLADAVDHAVKREVQLMKEQLAKGLPI